MNERELPSFLRLGTTNDLWNAAIDEAVRALEADYSIPSTWRFQAADTIKKVKRQ